MNDPRSRFAHLAGRFFNRPHAILPQKADVMMGVLTDRMGLSNIVRINGDLVLPQTHAMDDSEAGDWTGAGGDYETYGYDVAMGVARIEIEGTLVHKLGTLRPYSGMMGYDGIRQNFVEAMNDRGVKAIVLEIDSPGGEVSGCFDLAEMIYSYRGTKPVWAILNESAYSAAYAIAAAADKIIVPRTGGTGSIGIVMMHCDFSQRIAAEGIKVTFLKRGSFKTDGAPELPLSDQTIARFQAEIDTVGVMFEDLVSKCRGLSTDQIREMNAATFLGAEGVTLGLADEVMAPDAAFRALLAELG